MPAEDHCTLWFEGSWAHCCAAHDAAYAGFESRIAADLDLAQCVLAASGSAVMALTMLAGVVTFGWIFRAAGRRRRSAE